MNEAMLEFLRTEADHLDQAGLFRPELVVDEAGAGTITVSKRELLNLCSTDYLGLSVHTEVKRAAKAAIDLYGAGLCSSRIVAGTLPLHRELEQAVTRFLGTEDTLVFPSGYHASTGLLEALLSDKDHLFVDAQVQPGVADGVRLCRARVFQYRNRDINDLEDRLRRSRSARFRMIVTDGVFPLEGATAHLTGICNLAEKYQAMVVVEDSQGIGVLGPGGRGTADQLGATAQVDLIAGGFEHALGGGPGGFVSGRKEMVGWLRQKARPHLAQPALNPGAAAGALKAVELAAAGADLRKQLRDHTRTFREGLSAEGFRVEGVDHPTLAIHMGDAVRTQRMADLLFKKGLFVMGFCHPVVPEGKARIRAQVTVRHTQKALKAAAASFGEAARELGFSPTG